MGGGGRSALLPFTALSAAVALSACWVGGADFLVLVGGHVLRPVEVSVVAWSVGVLSALLPVATSVLRHRGSSSRAGLPDAVIGGLLAVTLVVTGAWCVGRAALTVGWEALGSSAFSVLRAPAGTGCTLIAQETDELRSSTGRLYAVGALGVARPVGTWSADEIQLPVRDRTYSLSWTGSEGVLALQGTRFIAPDRLVVTCPSQS